MERRISGSAGLAASRASLDEVCGLLVTPSPEALDQAAAILGRVVAEVAETRRRQGSLEQWQEYEGIQSAARRARALLDKAAIYHAGWNAWLGSLTGGYGPGGAAAAPVSGGRLSVEG
jgi:hypothetical protein